MIFLQLPLEAMKQSLNLPSLLHSLTNLTFACGTDIMPKRDITVITPIKIHFEYHTYHNYLLT